MVYSIKLVDEVAVVSIEETENKMLALERFGFNVLFSGDDWKGSERYLETEREFKSLGVDIVYLPYIKGISTTQIKGMI